jgi:hypothetical protein
VVVAVGISVDGVAGVADAGVVGWVVDVVGVVDGVAGSVGVVGTADDPTVPVMGMLSLPGVRRDPWACGCSLLRDASVPCASALVAKAQTSIEASTDVLR